ncbi:MAG: ABC transporter ATP-binding protein [Lachnospiraceae bacterium]|nr:ABC transporter ATP-binding protein [Lachnospiraceae bacterium]
MLEAKGISKSYGKQLVLDNVCLTIREGECVGLAGTNGVGKSTLLEILAGGIKSDAGEIVLQGEQVAGQKLASAVGFVPQENPLFEELTVKDNLELWYRGQKERLKKDLEMGVPAALGITDFYKKRVSRLSGGMKKRLSIACALSDNPDILILDEPGAALDLVAKQIIIDYLKTYVKAGHSVLLASHELPELQVCDRIYGIKDGCIEQLDKEINSGYLRQWMLS